MSGPFPKRVPNTETHRPSIETRLMSGHTFQRVLPIERQTQRMNSFLPKPDKQK
jgi:hypothetical protein